MKLFSKSKLKEKLAAKNSGFRHALVKAPDFDDSIFMVFEPPLSDWIAYVKVLRDNQENEELSEDEKIRILAESEAKLFIKCVRDESGNAIFDDSELSELIDVYGNAHSRILEQGLKLLSLDKNPMEIAEKK